jgi:hypothetical protein
MVSGIITGLASKNEKVVKDNYQANEQSLYFCA